jgi:hypothetical protein
MEVYSVGHLGTGEKGKGKIIIFALTAKQLFCHAIVFRVSFNGKKRHAAVAAI